MITTTPQIIHQTRAALIGHIVEIAALHPAQPAIGETVVITGRDDACYTGVVIAADAESYQIQVTESI